MTGADTTNANVFLPKRGGKLIRAYKLPNLAACRSLWDKRKGLRDWSVPIDPDTILAEDDEEENLPF